MLHILFTSDHEIHGNGDGCPRELMVEPTNRMMDLFDQYGAKLTIMADVAEILKFREFRDSTGRDEFHYDSVARQLQDALRRGHDVQLHVHPSYFNARYDSGRWLQDWAEYNFAALPAHRVDEIIRLGKQYLESLLRPIDHGYECIAFRAANWAMSPSHNVVQALLKNGIWIDTSVFKYGKREGIVSFDYSRAHSEILPWPVDQTDICRKDPEGNLWEMPIYAEHRWIGAFFSLNRIYRAYLSRRHRFDLGSAPQAQLSDRKARKSKANRVRKLFQRHAWKADFNQCSGRQLIRALERAEHAVGANAVCPFILIGHSKLFSYFNAWSLRPFLDYVANNPHRFRFSLFNQFAFVRHESIAA